MIMMSEFRCILGIAILVLFKEIHVGQCCITQQFSDENTVVKLSCSILTFSGTGSWSVDGGAAKTNCAPSSFCTTTVEGNYSFTSDSAGIYVTIDPFLSDEIGKLWKCENAPAFNCNITVSGPPASPNGGGSTGLTTGEIVGIVLPLVTVGAVVAVLCCILNTRCKFGDACKDSKLSFTFPTGGKEKVIPESNLGKDKGTPNKEVILNNEFKNGISSLTTSQPRSGANQPLKPVNES